jgi:subtilisin family serine protease
MASKKSKRPKPRKRSIECLEDRRVMSADPIAPLLGGLIERHDALDAPPLVQHAPTQSDFWLDPISERDFEPLTGDIDPMVANGDSWTGLSQVLANYGFTGAGQTVAVIDSGIAWDHVALGGGFGSNHRVVGGWDFAENDANPYDDGLYGSHGTHVAGIIGGDRSGSANDGVASGVDLVGLRVFNDTGQGYFGWVESALRWVHQYRNSFENPITAVNLSLGTSWNATTVPNWSTLEDEFAQLKADGIFVAVSAGNSFTTYNSPGLSYPAASPHVVPVMSADDSGSLSYFSQRQSRAIAAPGRGIVSSIPDYAGNHNGIADDYAAMSGTSMAAPFIAGASTIIRQAMQAASYTNITQDTIYNHMMATASTVFDAATNQSYKRINLSNAVASLQSANVTSTDWGTITQRQTNNVANTGTTLYKIRASQTGYLTAEAMFADSGGNIDIAILNSSLQVLASGAATSVGERADLWATAGTDYYVRVTGANSDIDFRITNLVSQSGKTVTVGGTTGNDAYWFDVGTTQRSVSINGTGYTFAKTAATTFNLDGGAGSDSATIVGTAKKETARLQYGYTTLTGTSINVVAVGMENVTVNGSGGADVVTLYDSAGNDSLGMYSGYAAMTGTGYSLIANGFKTATAYSFTGTDTAHVYDTTGNDTYRAYADRVEMKGAGYKNVAVGFENVTGHASAGVDKAYLYDSAGNDSYSTYAGYAAMTGNGYNNAANGFDTTFGYASYGYDTAYMYDSAGDDLYRSYSNKAIMSGNGFTNGAYAFDACYGYSSSGNDVARQYGSKENDQYNVSGFQSQMTGKGFTNTAIGFANYEARGLGGFDQAWIDESLLATQSAGSAWDEYATLAAVKKRTRGFDEMTVPPPSSAETGLNLKALDSLFGQLNDLS